MLLSHFPSQGEGSSVHETIVLVSGQGILSLHFSLFIFFPAKVILLSQFCKLLGQKVGMRDEWKAIYPITHVVYPLLLQEKKTHCNFAAEIKTTEKEKI